jgi:hypothetical protein
MNKADPLIVLLRIEPSMMPTRTSKAAWLRKRLLATRTRTSETV